ncbi:glycosyl transferase [Aeromonas dhakensis]|uniref:glycosyl transferase n=1 Tax=Aeromonas dhakensis TaxID=196024 RepID=UPI002B475887|nr:glycosyl transferase [Aeromonas dhakensis]
MLIIAISTLFKRLDGIKKEQFPSNENIKYVISCQGKKEHDDAYYESYLRAIFGDDVVWGEAPTSGLSNNRNNAIKLALESKSETERYLYICDDDITLSVDGLLDAIGVMRERKLSCLTGIVATDDGFFRNYSNQTYSHSRLSAARVCSVEIVVDLEFVFSKNILFDSRFGLGSIYPSGEEFIFLNDLISAGAKVDFSPIILCKHPPLSSGDDFYSSQYKIMAKGAMLKRVFPSYICYPMIIMFAIKKYRAYRDSVSFLKFCNNMIKGAIGMNK